MLDIKTLHDLTNNREYQSYISDKLGNDLFINDPERAERIQEYAENGGDGSLYCEIIEDMRDFLNSLKIFDSDYNDPEEKNSCDMEKSIYDSILKEIDEVEQWHEKNGSLYDIIN